MSRSIDWPCESGRWIFPKYVGVVVDVLDVVDRDARLLLELLEGRALLRLLVDVDVELPVREAQRVGERLLGGGGSARFVAATVAVPAAGGDDSGEREHGAAERGPAQELEARQLVGHTGSSSL